MTVVWLLEFATGMGQEWTSWDDRVADLASHIEAMNSIIKEKKTV
jgi:hypothetical protein